MKPSFDRVILSTNENPKYIEFWPLIPRAWRKLFGVEVSLAFLTERSEHDPLVARMRDDGEVVLFKPLDMSMGIPQPNNTKVLRLILASSMGAEVCLLNDIDMMPLQRGYTEARTRERRPEELLCVGKDFYRGSRADGKFPMPYLTTEGSTFHELVNPQSLTYEDLVRSWIGTRIFDDQEDIALTIHHEHADCFSDESLLRVLIHRWKERVGADRLRYVDSGLAGSPAYLNRADWNLDLAELAQGAYVQAHLPRPLSSAPHLVDPLIDYVFGAEARSVRRDLGLWRRALAA